MTRGTRTPTRVLAGILAVLAAVAVASCSPAERSGGGPSPTTAVSGPEAPHNSDDVGFAQMMIPHHQQALELSALVPERSTDPGVLALAGRIADEQQPEIDMMKALLAQWRVEASGHSGHGGMPMAGMVDPETMNRLKSLRGNDFDTLWLQSMIAHHRGAVEMAEVEVRSGENPELTALARSIISAQQAEIVEMETMLAAGR